MRVKHIGQSLEEPPIAYLATNQKIGNRLCALIDLAVPLNRGKTLLHAQWAEPINMYNYRRKLKTVFCNQTHLHPGQIRLDTIYGYMNVENCDWIVRLCNFPSFYSETRALNYLPSLWSIHSWNGDFLRIEIVDKTREMRQSLIPGIPSHLCRRNTRM